MKRMQKLLIYAIILTLTGTFSLAYESEDTIKRTFPIDPNGTVRLKTVRGDIELSTHDGEDVKIEAMIFAEDDRELQKVNIEFSSTGDTVAIYTSIDLNRVNAEIVFYLKVPENLNTLQMSTLSGGIKVRGSHKHLILTTINGDIDVDGEFYLCQAKSTNGDIEVVQSEGINGDISAKNTNGFIKIRLNENSDFTVTGKTMTGEIRTEFNTGVITDVKGSKIKGIIKDGTYKIDIDTINGDIYLLMR